MERKDKWAFSSVLSFAFSRFDVRKLFITFIRTYIGGRRQEWATSVIVWGGIVNFTSVLFSSWKTELNIKKNQIFKDYNQNHT